MAVRAGWSAWWTLRGGTNRPAGGAGEFDSPGLGILVAQPLLWAAQVIGAFPARDELAPPGSLALVAAAYWILLATAARSATRRGAWTLALLLALSVAVPMTLTLTAHDQLGFFWQGRYGWPYSVGLPLVAGFLLDRAARTGRLGVLLVRGTVLVALVAATAWGQVDVLWTQIRTSPLAGDDAWLRAGAPVVALLTAAGLTLIAAVASWPGPGRARGSAGPSPVACARDLAR